MKTGELAELRKLRELVETFLETRKSLRSFRGHGKELERRIERAREAWQRVEDYLEEIA